MVSAKIELLSPAGSISTAICALDAGADAVYGGVADFNARKRSENFTFEELSKCICYAHSCGKKFYIALNTMIKEQELANFARILAKIAALKPDAAIVQDLGVLRMVRKYFPDLPIHASTQMALHNSAGVRGAAAMGVGRVILERQLSIEEISAIVKKSPVEIEVFVHGALCPSLSGICLMSSWISGQSGNRGLCKQPCRRAFRDSSGKTAFHLSCRDLCAIDDLDLLMQTGVRSLKIEGRLRKNDYVHYTVSAYRLVLDSKPAERSEAIKEAKEMLALTCPRSLASPPKGEAPFHSMIESGKSGNVGIPVAKIEKMHRRGFEVYCLKKIHLGDRLRIQPASNAKGSIFTAREIFIDGKSAVESPPGRRCVLDSERSASPGDMIFKIGESLPDLEKKIARLPLRHPLGIELSVEINEGGFAAKADSKGFESFRWTRDVLLEPARSNPVRKEQIEEDFMATRTQFLQVSKITVAMKEGLFLPTSVLKESRRQFWECATVHFKQGGVPDGEVPAKLFSEIESIRPRSDEAPEITVESGAEEIVPHGKTGIKADGLFRINPDTDEVILPFFCSEKNLPELESAIDLAFQRGVRRFRVRSLFALFFLKKYKGIRMASAYPLCSMNSFSIAELKELGFSKVQISPELDEKSISDLIGKSPVPLEIFASGSIPILVTRAHVSADSFLRDEFGALFHLSRQQKDGLTLLYPCETIKFPSLDGVSKFHGTILENQSGKKTSAFNFSRTLE